ncbi:hypothetical protein [Pseudoalteromonas sp. MMG022]|nr:hypothetical protein [Pseudoalteromonas sp. MMG022]
MYSYIMIGANDFDSSKRFYDATLEVLISYIVKTKDMPLFEFM